MRQSIASPAAPSRAGPRPDPELAPSPEPLETTRRVPTVSPIAAGFGSPADPGARQVTAPRRQTLLALQRTVGNAAVQRLLTRPAAAPAPAPGGAPIRRFNEDEHKPLGDNATGSAKVNLGGEAGVKRFDDLTFGDVVTLSGDWFDPKELMKLAAIPGDRGAKLGTRDEIVCALKEALPKDPRFQKGGIWESWVLPAGAKAGTPRFDALTKVKESVEDRFNVLASKNASHYAAPRGRDATGAPLPTKKGEASAGGAYRHWHEEALWLAYRAGAGLGGSLSHAMAMEAAAAHFLTDAFAAGHVRTPIGLMRDHWGGLYPLFWYNLLHKIAVDTAAEINRQDTNLVTVFGSVQAIYEEVLSEVEQKVGNVIITLGDLVAKIFHDFDNEQGVTIQSGGKVFGDSHLDKSDPSNVTRARAEDAIRAGTKEIRVAANLGMSQAGLKKADVLTQVLGQTAGPAGQYAAEAMIPLPDASNPAQNWKAPTIEALWTQPIVKGATVTVGQQITKALQPGGALHNKLEAFAAKFPPTKQKYGSTLHPQDAYRTGFFKPMVADPEKGVLSIVHWAPNTGLADKDRDDISLATGNELMKGTKRGENLKGMTTLARIRYVRELVGSSVADDEEALVLQIFKTAPASERPKIYQGVEGHAWKGNWIHGITKDDDEIWNALKRYRLEILRNLINEGWSGKP